MTTTAPEKITIPTSAAELEAMLGDGKQMMAMVGKPEFGEFISAYARTVYDKDLSIQTQVREQTQRHLAEWLKDNQPEGVNRVDLTPRDVIERGTPKNALHNPRAMGAALDKDFATGAEYFRTIWHNTNNTADRQAKLSKIRNAFSSTVPSEGGFLIPESLRSELLQVALEASVVRQRARVVPMETLRVPYPMIDSTSNVSSTHGGIVTYWTEEGAQLTRSAAKFGRVVLDAKKLTAFAVVPNELIADSILSFETFINTAFPSAMAFGEDDAFLNGSGVGEPLGSLSTANSATVAVAAEDGQPAGSIVWENIVKMYARMLPGSLNSAVWVVSPSTFPELATMALSVGTGGSAIWLNNGASGPPMTILGRPVIISEKVSAVGTRGDINFVDFGYYLVGDRQVMSAMSSEHSNFDTDETAFRLIQRLDGRPWLQSAITPKNGGDALTPFVQLATRS